MALDPGHGGKDPGTIGRRGTYEKEITIAVATDLARRLEATGRYKVLLTRRSDVFLPLARLIHLQVAARQRLFTATATFLGDKHPEQPVPFIIGVAGSVAVGKSTAARVIQALLARWPNHPRVDLVTTDGFLYPNAVLQREDLMEKKGFPESYDLSGLLRFLSDVKAGKRPARAPIYSHLIYDVMPNQWIEIDQPDILIVLNENRAILTEAGAEGPPDFVIEILSPKTRKLDLDNKKTDLRSPGRERALDHRPEPSPAVSIPLRYIRCRPIRATALLFANRCFERWF